MSPGLALALGLIGLIAIVVYAAYQVGIRFGAERNQRKVTDWLNREQGRIQEALHDGKKPADHGDALDRL